LPSRPPALRRPSARSPARPTTTVEQLITVTKGDDATAACCPSGYTVVNGNAWGNIILRLDSRSYCILGQGGDDYLQPGTPVLDFAADRVFGGPGNDTLFCTAGGSMCTGGDGNDSLSGLVFGADLRGGPGNDTVVQLIDGTFWGNDGDDVVGGLLGSNTVYPGAGRDAITAGLGNDKIVIYDACELVAGEILDGGLGNDTLVSPLTAAELQQRGVLVLGVENFVLDQSKRFLATCY
jgi:Ca2+-binding RTX toxin-like protein